MAAPPEPGTEFNRRHEEEAGYFRLFTHMVIDGRLKNYESDDPKTVVVDNENDNDYDIWKGGMVRDMMARFIFQT